MNAIEAYQQTLLSGPDPLLEPDIANDSQASFQYSMFVLQAPFPGGETAIALDPQTAFQYSLLMLKAPFPEGEAAISASNMASEYTIFVEKFSSDQPSSPI